MANFFWVIVRCIQHVFQIGYSWISFVLGAIGALKDIAGIEIPFVPSWAWWLGALAALFVVVVRLQYQLDSQGGDVIRRLHLKKYVTFREIADSLPKVYTAYSKRDIYLQLARAVANREFEEFSGHPRLRLAYRDSNDNIRPEMPLQDGVELLNAAVGKYDPDNELLNRHVHGALYEDAIGSKDYDDALIGALTFEHGDFVRWYRRFRRGRYER